MAEQTFGKTTDYNASKNDFVGESELCVQITLCEYRELVGKVATRDKDIKKAEDEARADRYKAQELEKENAELKAELYELKKKVDGLENIITVEETNATEKEREVQPWE